jgi:hypothetical protein
MTFDVSRLERIEQCERRKNMRRCTNLIREKTRMKLVNLIRQKGSKLLRKRACRIIGG